MAQKRSMSGNDPKAIHVWCKNKAYFVVIGIQFGYIFKNVNMISFKLNVAFPKCLGHLKTKLSIRAILVPKISIFCAAMKCVTMVTIANCTYLGSEIIILS